MIRRSTWIVLTILVVLIGVVIYLQKRGPAAEDLASETPPTSPLLDVDLMDITGIRVVSSEGKIFYATRLDGNNWTLVQPGLSDELNQDVLESDLSQLINLQPLSRLETGLGLEAMGLLSPTYTIRLSVAGQQERLLEVGAETPTKSGYYLRVDNTDLVVVPIYNLQSILDLLEEIPLVTPTPN